VQPISHSANLTLAYDARTHKRMLAPCHSRWRSSRTGNARCHKYLLVQGACAISRHHPMFALINLLCHAREPETKRARCSQGAEASLTHQRCSQGAETSFTHAGNRDDARRRPRGGDAVWISRRLRACCAQGVAFGSWAWARDGFVLQAR
jgi:hypothetical protein